MKHHLTILDKLIHTFREFTIYHHQSLEFRAKMYAVMIMANSQHGECELEKLSSIAEKVYPDSVRRQNSLILAVEEYIDKIIRPNGLGIDELIFDIEKDLKREKRFTKKINIEHLHLLSQCTKDRESQIYQKRIIEFFKKLKKEKG